MTVVFSPVCCGSWPPLTTVLRIDKGYPGGAAHFWNCSYNYGSYIYELYIL